MPRSIEDLYNKLQQNHWYLLPAGTWEKNFTNGQNGKVSCIIFYYY